MDPAAVLQSLHHGPIPGDFDAYFVLGKHMVEGAHAYDSAAVMAVQHSLGRVEDYANLVWYSPHVLPLFCLFGLLPYGVAWPAWLVLQMGLVFASVDRLWIFAGGSRQKRHHAWFLALAFYPVLALAVWRQAGGLLLAGLAGFMILERKGRDVAAGACLALLAIKPQLAYLAWLGIAVWVVRTRRLRIPLGTLAVIGVGIVLDVLINASFTWDYLGHMAHRPPDQLIAPALGSQLRRLFPSHPYPLQFVPALLGVAWFVLTWKRRREQDITAQLPQLLSVGFVLSVFYWTPDLVLLLVWMVPALATLSVKGGRHAWRTLLAPLVGISLVALPLHELLLDHHFYALAIAYALLLRFERASVSRRL